MLNSKQRAKLLSYSNTIPDGITIGIAGLTKDVEKNISDYLLAHELLKIKVQKGYEGDLRELASSIEKAVSCDIVRVIGRKIICYKYSPKDIKHYEI